MVGFVLPVHFLLAITCTVLLKQITQITPAAPGFVDSEVLILCGATLLVSTDEIQKCGGKPLVIEKPAKFLLNRRIGLQFQDIMHDLIITPTLTHHPPILTPPDRLAQDVTGRNLDHRQRILS